MQKILGMVACAAATMSFASAASAVTYSPAGQTISVANIGTVTASKGGTTFTCSRLTGQGSISSNGQSAQLNSLTFSGSNSICGSIRFTGLPYAIRPTSSTTATLVGVNVTSLLGSCAGDINGNFDQSTGRISFNNATLPSSDGSSGCSITVTLSTSPQASYTFP